MITVDRGRMYAGESDRMSGWYQKDHKAKTSHTRQVAQGCAAEQQFGRFAKFWTATFLGSTAIKNGQNEHLFFRSV